MPLFVSTHQAPGLSAQEIAGHADFTQRTEEPAEMAEQVSNG